MAFRKKASADQILFEDQNDKSGNSEHSPLLPEESSSSSSSSSFLIGFRSILNCIESTLCVRGLTTCLDRFFKISENGSSIGVEIKAGLVTWLTMSYIFLINPKILHHAGVPAYQAATSTCLCSGVATLIVGLFGNLPVGCAPGIGLSAALSFSLVPTKVGNDIYEGEEMGFKVGLTVSFVTACVLLVVWLFRLSDYLTQWIPFTIKISTIVGMGFFLSFVGFITSKVVVVGDYEAPLRLGDMGDWTTSLSVATLILIIVLRMFHLKGSLIIGVVVATAIIWFIDKSYPSSVVMLPDLGTPINFLDFRLLGPTAVYVILALLLIINFDVSGVLLAVTYRLPLSYDSRQVRWVHFATAFGTLLASMTGCSPIIVHLESLSGIGVGGRTGLTAITVALLFFMCMFIGPVIVNVPVEACAPVLMCLGILMMKETQQIDWDNIRMALPAFLTISIMPLTWSVPNGLYFGLGSYIILYMISFEWLPNCKDDTEDRIIEFSEAAGTSSRLSKFKNLIDDMREDSGQSIHQKVRALELLDQMESYIRNNGDADKMSSRSRSVSLLQIERERSRSLLQIGRERGYSGGM